MTRPKLLVLITALVILLGAAIGFGILSERIASDLSGEAAAAILTLAGTTWFAIWSFYKTKRKEADAQIFSEKAAVYKNIIDILRDVFFASKGWAPPVDTDDLAKRFGQVRFDMIIWGGQDTIRAITRMEEADTNTPGSQFAAAVNLFAQIRRELGHADDPALAEDLFLSQVIGSDREQVRQLIRANAPPSS